MLTCLKINAYPSKLSVLKFRACSHVPSDIINLVGCIVVFGQYNFVDDKLVEFFSSLGISSNGQARQCPDKYNSIKNSNNDIP